MKNYLTIGLIFIYLCISSCKNNIKTDNELVVSKDTTNKVENVDIKKTEEFKNLEIKNELSEDEQKIVGEHLFGLQWIDGTGKAIISNENGMLKIYGKHTRNNDFVEINGFLSVETPEKLIFEGKIISKVSYVNNGEICKKNGKFTFKSRNGRKYWRLQEMQNCEGNNVVDYVDIYYKN